MEQKDKIIAVVTKRNIEYTILDCSRANVSSSSKPFKFRCFFHEIVIGLELYKNHEGVIDPLLVFDDNLADIKEKCKQNKYKTTTFYNQHFNKLELSEAKRITAIRNGLEVWPDMVSSAMADELALLYAEHHAMDAIRKHGFENPYRM